MGWFFKVLYTICEFYTILEEYETSLKLYNELREAAIMLKDYEYLVASLIGIAKCAGHANLTSEAVTILKKALEYAWYVRSVELEINIYDELGEKYYKLGDLEKANIFHMKYANAIMEEDGSPLRKLSRKQISIVEEANTAQKYENVSQSFLAHLTLPIKNTEELFPLIPTLITARENMPEPRMIKTVSEMGCSNGIETQIRRILKHWMFEIEGQEPNLDEAKMIENEKKNTFNARKFIFIDFKMNQHLKEKGIRLNPSPNLALPTHVQSKELGWEAAWNGVKKKTYSGFRTYQKDRHPNKFKHKQ
jgi:tetratricopeptide (TPR) repeat protein